MRRRRRAARRCRRRRPCRVDAVVGPVRGPDRRVTARRSCPPGVPVLSVEAGSDVRLGAVRRRLDRDRPLRRRARRASSSSSSSGINVDHVVRVASALTAAHERTGQHSTTGQIETGRRSNAMSTNRLQATLRRTGPEPLARQPQARLPHLGRARRAARPRHPRPHLEPDDLPEGDPGSTDYDEQFRELVDAVPARSSDDYWALVLQDINGALDVFDAGVRRRPTASTASCASRSTRPRPRRDRAPRPRPATCTSGSTAAT